MRARPSTHYLSPIDNSKSWQDYIFFLEKDFIQSEVHESIFFFQIFCFDILPPPLSNLKGWKIEKISFWSLAFFMNTISPFIDGDWVLCAEWIEAMLKLVRGTGSKLEIVWEVLYWNASYDIQFYLDIICKDLNLAQLSRLSLSLVLTHASNKEPETLTCFQAKRKCCHKPEVRPCCLVTWRIWITIWWVFYPLGLFVFNKHFNTLFPHSLQ